MSELDLLLEAKPVQRDEAWEKKFLAALPQTPVKLLSQTAQEGPDGWPYLMLGTGEDADEPLANVLHWLSTRGIGLALNPQKSTPDFVLTYGMIWNFRERGEFITSDVSAKPSKGDIEIKEGQEILTGPPNESFFPSYARAIVKQFLLDQGAFAPKILMVSFDRENYDLCFSIESLQSPPQHEHAQIAEALSWFFPSHYTISLVSEKAIAGFIDL